MSAAGSMGTSNIKIGAKWINLATDIKAVNQEYYRVVSQFPIPSQCLVCYLLCWCE